MTFCQHAISHCIQERCTNVIFLSFNGILFVDDCSTVNGVVGKYSHITTALIDIVEAYMSGKNVFAETKDNLVESLHSLDARITNEGIMATGRYCID